MSTISRYRTKDLRVVIQRKTRQDDKVRETQNSCWALLVPFQGFHLLGPVGPWALLGPSICWTLLGPGPCWGHSFVGPCWGHSFIWALLGPFQWVFPNKSSLSRNFFMFCQEVILGSYFNINVHPSQKAWKPTFEKRVYHNLTHIINKYDIIDSHINFSLVPPSALIL